MIMGIVEISSGKYISWKEKSVHRTFVCVCVFVCGGGVCERYQGGQHSKTGQWSCEINKRIKRVTS